MVFKKVSRLGQKAVGGIKRFGHKHKGKIAVLGAIAGGLAYAESEYQKDGPNKRARATADAERIMGRIAEVDQREAEELHNKLMDKAQPQPQGGGNLAPVEPAKPGVIGMVGNIPKATQQLEAGVRAVEEAGVFKKGKKAQEVAVGVTAAINEPTKRAKKKADKFNEENRRFLAGEMTDKEARKFIKKKAKRDRKK